MLPDVKARTKTSTMTHQDMEDHHLQGVGWVSGFCCGFSGEDDVSVHNFLI